MEVANRVAVSASIPGALNRIQGQYGEEIWGIGGPLEARARVRLGPASSGFYSVQARPLWSSVIEVRTQFLIPGFDGDAQYVGRVQRGFVQPAVYGAGELNVWRFQFAPGAGILVGDREAHVDLSLRMSVQLLDRLFGDVEALRRQALAVPSEPGRCQSAWMGAAGLRFQLRRGVFISARYVGGQGDCVPQHSFMLNLGLAFGEEHMRIPTADEVGFIKKWHAILMGMVDPVLDCQGIMRADDGTPMFRFGYPDAHNPSIIWRNHSSYHVGEHFWEKGGRLYRDTDLTHPVLDLFGEAPLTFAERAAMHDCPTLPGLGSPCQVALNLPALRQKVERGDSPVQVALAEDAQILACLNHVSPLKAAAMFTAIQAALGPLLAKLPQVSRWLNPAAPPIPAPSAPAAAPAAPPPAPRPPPGSVVVSTWVQAADSSGYQDGPSAEARFDEVAGAAVIGDELYVSDSGNGVIRRVTLPAGVVSTLTGKQRDFNTVNGTLAESRFYKPGPLVAVGKTLYVVQLATEHGGSCIRSIDLAAGRTATLTGSCQRQGNLDGGPDTALFSSPRALTTDGQNLYVGDYVRVRAVSLATGAVTTLAGEADAQCDFGLQRICKGGFVDGVGNQARLIGIRALALSGRTLYIADGEAIRALDLEEKKLTTVIGAARGIGSDDGVGVKAGVSSVTGLSAEAGGLYILQGPNFAGLRHLNLMTKALVSLTGQTIPGFARGSGNVDGPAAKADFSKPKLLVADGNRLLIIHEQGRIRAFEKF